jgi:hypothetical protein
VLRIGGSEFFTHANSEQCLSKLPQRLASEVIREVVENRDVFDRSLHGRIHGVLTNDLRREPLPSPPVNSIKSLPSYPWFSNRGA